MKTIYNCHAHIFTNEIVPEKFLPLGITRFLSKRPVSRWLGKLLNRLNPRSSNDIFDRFASFMNIGNFKSQLDIFEFLKGFYPEETKFVVLSMDMEYMGAGKIHEDFTKQLSELSDIKKKYPDQFFPFICVDPRRPNIADMVKKYIEEHGNYRSVMNYYYIYDKTLVDYSDGSHGNGDFDDWSFINLTFFQDNAKVFEDPGFELPGVEEIGLVKTMVLQAKMRHIFR